MNTMNPKQKSIVRSAFWWCRSIQSFFESLEPLVSFGISLQDVQISLPRDVYYAVTTYRHVLKDHFSFLNYPVTLKSSTTPSSSAPFKFTLNVAAPATDTPEAIAYAKSNAIPDNYRLKYNIPAQMYIVQEAEQFKGDNDGYQEFVNQKYLKMCKDTGQEPEYK